MNERLGQIAYGFVLIAAFYGTLGYWLSKREQQWRRHMKDALRGEE